MASDDPSLAGRTAGLSGGKSSVDDPGGYEQQFPDCDRVPADGEVDAFGSGLTEGLCKTMAARLKGSGMRWDPAGAETMLHLTAPEDSNEWEAYWRLQGVHQD